MTSVLLALVLGAAPELWVAAEGFDREACNADALAAAVRTQRPGVDVRVWRGLSDDQGRVPPADAIRVQLTAGAFAVRLEVNGAGTAIARDLPAADGCERSVELAALIVDGALDEIKGGEGAPQVDSLAPPVPFRTLVQLGAALGAGTEQGPFPTGFVATLDAEGFARYRFFELTLDVDVALPPSVGVDTSPEPGPASLSVILLDAILGLGVAPRLGPGRLSADLVLGLSLGFASANGGSGVLRAQSTQTSTELFVGLRLGYLVELPLNLFVGARVEERLAPDEATFEIPDANPSVGTRTWTFQALGLVGYRFL